MKTSLICLVIALLWHLAASQTVEVYNDFGKQDDKHWQNAARVIYICGGIHGRWLEVVRFNTQATDQRGFDPSYTYCVSKFRPVLKQLPNGMWQISFTSDIARNIP